MHNQADLDKKEKRKILSAVTAITAIILVLIVAIVVVATKKSDHKNSVVQEENTSFEMKDEDSAEHTSNNDFEKNEEDKDTNNTVTGVISTEKSTNKNESKKTETPEPSEPVVATVSEMPSTGPEDLLPLALMAGALMIYLSSVILVKREA